MAHKLNSMIDSYVHFQAGSTATQKKHLEDH